jgi:CRP-like cAMP-binding protein
MSFFQYSKTHADFFVANGQKVTYPKERYLVTVHDESNWVFFLSSGQVQVLFGFTDGAERLIGYFLPGMTFAQSGSFYDDAGGSLEYKAITEVTAYRIPRQMFLAELATSKKFNAEYMDAILRNQIFLIDRIVYQGEHAIENKFLRWLCFMTKYYGEPEGNLTKIMIKLSQEDIANFLHVTRVSINKLVSYHKAADLLTVSDRTLYIDMKILNAVLGEKAA